MTKPAGLSRADQPPPDAGRRDPNLGNFGNSIEEGLFFNERFSSFLEQKLGASLFHTLHLLPPLEIHCNGETIQQWLGFS